jgi:hypothetical protein
MVDKPVKIQDIQIRLCVEVQGALFVCTWYGPQDKMRFAAFKRENQQLTQDEIYELEQVAKVQFAEKIKELEEKFTTK